MVGAGHPLQDVPMQHGFEVLRRGDGRDGWALVRERRQSTAGHPLRGDPLHDRQEQGGRFLSFSWSTLR